MSSDDSTLQDTSNPTLHVSSVDISLAKGSRKKIRSVKLRKNDDSLRDVRKAICAGGVHREEFYPPFTLDPDDRISVSVNCDLKLWKQIKITLVINLRDIEYMRAEQGVRLYRKEARNVAVVVTGYQSSCPQFRLLIIGNSGVGKTSLIYRVFGAEDVHGSATTRGVSNIDTEFISAMNKRFVVHDSLGFESYETVDMVKEFVARRRAMPGLRNQLHAVWLCLEIPYAGNRLLEAGVARFLQRRDEILGKIPLVVVLTKMDLLDIMLEVELPENENTEYYKSRYLKEHCIGPLCAAAGSDITYVTVSAADGYSESLSNLVKATDQNVVKYLDEAPRIATSIT
ncbi:hypothetical protein EV363DRAFT_1486982 [Boletus edulis]|nr:hypothetical protein EV363DRAFT_1486982 [Boletus edulis]